MSIFLRVAGLLSRLILLIAAFKFLGILALPLALVSFAGRMAQVLDPNTPIKMAEFQAELIKYKKGAK